MVRVSYLLFVPAWIYLAVSIYRGIRVQRAYLGFLLRSNAVLKTTKEAMNADAYAQIHCMQIGLAFLGLWLLIYLLWWVFAKKVQHSLAR